MKALLLSRLLGAVVWLPLLAGCVQLAEVDSTADPRYREMIGREYALREEFRACGVKREHPSPDFEHVVIQPPPGLGGRYIVDLGRIPAGSRFRIIGVITRRSELFPATEYAISFLDHRVPGAEGRDVRINGSGTAVWELYLKPATPSAAPPLNPRFFRPLGDIPR